MHTTPQFKIQQAGVALITALVVTAIAVSLAVTLAYRQQVAIRLSGNLSALEQAYQYATGMEDWAGVILSNDLQDNNTDSLKDDWATLIPPIPIPGGYMNGQLFDLHARINLNNLIETVNQNGQNVQRPVALQVERLKTLLNYLKIPEPDALVDSLIDWLDENDQESNLGAESAYYKTLDPPYLAANSRLVVRSELGLVKGFNEKFTNSKGEEESILKKLLPFVAMIPAKRMLINVNTADFEVLYALGNVDETQVRETMDDREVDPFPTISDFVRSLGFVGQNTFSTDRLGVSSEYFLLQGLVQIGRVRVFINSVIHRDSTGRTRVISREFSQP
ncbi:MAG: type II secretion system minor pseudopilin GspK [Thiotrichaceae bacterium]